MTGQTKTLANAWRTSVRLSSPYFSFRHRYILAFLTIVMKCTDTSGSPRRCQIPFFIISAATAKELACRQAMEMLCQIHQQICNHRFKKRSR